jgi:hypothetical protein
MELAICNSSGAKNFEVATRCLENLCTPVQNISRCAAHLPKSSKLARCSIAR